MFGGALQNHRKSAIPFSRGVSCMKRVLLAVSALTLIWATGAKADIIFLGQQDLGGLGFGAFPRMLTLQTSGVETGSVTPVDVTHDQAVPGADKSTTPTIATLNWQSGADVKIAFNADTSNTGITVDNLILTVFNGTTGVGSFSLAASITFTQAQVAAEQGNGNGVFVFGLNAAQQAQFNTILAGSGSSGFFVGLNSTLGCGASPPAGCIATNDGPDTFLGVVNPVPGPVVGAGLPGLMTALLGMLGLSRYRRRRQT